MNHKKELLRGPMGRQWDLGFSLASFGCVAWRLLDPHVQRGRVVSGGGGVIYFAFPAMPPEEEVRRPILGEFIEILVGGRLMLISCRLVAVARAIVKLEGPGAMNSNQESPCRTLRTFQRPTFRNPETLNPTLSCHNLLFCRLLSYTLI